MSKRDYWAAAPSTEIAKHIESKFSDYRKWLNDTGYGAKIQRSYDTFYTSSSEGGFGISTNWDSGKSKISVNHYKNLIQRLHGLCTQAKLNWQTRARNSDSRSQVQSEFAKGLLEFYQDEKGLDKSLKQAVEMSLVMFESFIHLPWDELKGEGIRPDENGNVIQQGDQDIQVLSPFNVARPISNSRTPFYILELSASKYDLAALYPQFEDAILSAGNSDYSMSNDRLITPYNNNLIVDDDDSVNYFVFYHPPTPALPSGRETWVINGETVKDGPLKYQKVPVVRMNAGQVLESVAGDSPASSLVSLQEGLDRLFGAVLTNNLNGAVSNIYSPDTNTDLRRINEGMNLIVGTTAPQAISLVGSSPETYKFIDSLIQNQQLLSGVNSTARGQPETNAKTAGGQSLMIAMAIQSISDLQSNYARAASEMGTIIINNLQSFCSEPMLAYIGGESRKAYVKEFTNEDIKEVDRVSVDLGNPLLQTVGGRFDLVQQWTQMGILQDPVKAIEFLRTGQVDSLTEDKFKDSILIRSENEMLKKGEAPIVMVSDMHPSHILQHKEVLNDPEARLDAKVSEAVTQHLMDHIAAYKNIDPDLAAILGLAPLPSMQAGPSPQESSPEIEGQPIPNTPNGTPPQIEQGFEESMNSLPQGEI
jgi:hypothetical protein